MPEKYVKRTNFWENLTLLDSSHLKIFLEFFLGNFHFFEFKFEFWIWAGFVPAQTGTVPDRFGEPWQLVARTGWRARGGWKAVICYCSVTVTNHSGIWLIRYILKSYTHPWKSFANKLRLVLHACIRLFMYNVTKHGQCKI